MIIISQYFAKYCVDYHPWLDGQNPNFDQNSGLIISFKNGYPSTLLRFADLIEKDFDPKWENCVCVAVPSSDPGQTPTPVQKLIKHLVASHPGLIDGSDALVRRKKIQKSHMGGSRKLKNHLDTIRFNRKANIDFSGKKILLIDDVKTTGNSLRACVIRLKRELADTVKDRLDIKVYILTLAQDVFEKNLLRFKRRREPKDFKEQVKRIEAEGFLFDRVDFCEDVLAVSKKYKGEKHPDTISAMNDLAFSLSSECRFEEALALSEEALSLSKKALGKDHPVTLEAMSILAFILSTEGRYEDALKLRKNVLTSTRKVSGKESPDTISAMDNVASSLSDIGEFKKALRLRKDVLELSQKLLGEKHPQTYSAMSDLANSYIDAGKYKEAEALFKQLEAMCS
jgi:tetratricopeptide (TPR) repeat protein